MECTRTGTEGQVEAKIIAIGAFPVFQIRVSGTAQYTFTCPHSAGIADFPKNSCCTKYVIEKAVSQANSSNPIPQSMPKSPEKPTACFAHEIGTAALEQVLEQGFNSAVQCTSAMVKLLNR
jgi:hypothetical protein